MTRKILKVGQLGSFIGNIGDIVNHESFRIWLEFVLGSKIQWQNFEIRDCYRGKKKLNPDFIEFANKQDLVVIGGGNFFELWPENSCNGTSIDLSYMNLKAIECPVFFNSLGVDGGQGVGNQAQKNFKNFFNEIANDDQFFISVRNDGSIAQLQEMGILTARVKCLPDAAFFYKGSDQRSPRSDMSIAINIAMDMPHIRYKDGTGEHFLDSIAEVLKELSSSNHHMQFTLVPHIYSDLIFITRLLERLPEQIVREKITVERYDASVLGAREIARTYATCNLVIAQRFHANVIPIALGTPVIGLDSYPQIWNLYHEIANQENSLKIDADDFSSNLIQKASIILQNPNPIIDLQNSVVTKLERERYEVGRELVSWLSGHLNA
jgi:polysaccharide pyruvyl transferase WcaK-like protein